MAKIENLHAYRGTIDDITCRKTEFGYVANKKSSLTRERVLHDDNYELTRRYAGEFKLATKNATLLRHALDKALNTVQRSSLNGHVISLMRQMGEKDTTSLFGRRHAGAGDLSLMKGFELGNTLLLDEALPASFTHKLTLQEGIGTVQVSIPKFIARCKKNVLPEGATHIRIISCASIIHFNNNGYAGSIGSTELLPLNKKTREAITFEHQLKVEAGEVLLHALGVEFYEVVRGKSKLLKNGALKIIDLVQSAPPVEQASSESDNNTGTSQPFSYKELLCDLKQYIRRLSGRELAARSNTFQKPSSCDHPTALPTSPAIMSATKSKTIVTANPNTAIAKDLVRLPNFGYFLARYLYRKVTPTVSAAPSNKGRIYLPSGGQIRAASPIIWGTTIE